MSLKKCPFCAEEIQAEAIKCRYCGSDLLVGATDDHAAGLADVIGRKRQSRARVLGYVIAAATVFAMLLYCYQQGSQEAISTAIVRETSTPVVRESSTPVIHEESTPIVPVEKTLILHKMRTQVNIGYMAYSVWRARYSKRISRNELLDQPPDAMYLIITLNVQNNDTQARTIPPFTLVDKNGAEYETSSSAWTIEDSIGALDSLNPGVAKTGNIVFDVPQGRQYYLKVSGGFWSSESALIIIATELYRGD